MCTELWPYITKVTYIHNNGTNGYSWDENLLKRKLKFFWGHKNDVATITSLYKCICAIYTHYAWIRTPIYCTYAFVCMDLGCLGANSILGCLLSMQKHYHLLNSCLSSSRHIFVNMLVPFGQVLISICTYKWHK